MTEGEKQPLLAAGANNAVGINTSPGAQDGAQGEDDEEPDGKCSPGALFPRRHKRWWACCCGTFLAVAVTVAALVGVFVSNVNELVECVGDMDVHVQSLRIDTLCADTVHAVLNLTIASTCEQTLTVAEGSMQLASTGTSPAVFSSVDLLEGSVVISARSTSSHVLTVRLAVLPPRDDSVAAMQAILQGLLDSQDAASPEDLDELPYQLNMHVCVHISDFVLFNGGSRCQSFELGVKDLVAKLIKPPLPTATPTHDVPSPPSPTFTPTHGVPPTPPPATPTNPPKYPGPATVVVTQLDGQEDDDGAVHLSIHMSSFAVASWLYIESVPNVPWSLLSQGRLLVLAQTTTRSFNAGAAVGDALNVTVSMHPGPFVYYILHNNPYMVRQSLGIASPPDAQSQCLVAALTNGLTFPFAWTAPLWFRLLNVDVAGTTNSSLLVQFGADTSSQIGSGLRTLFNASDEASAGISLHERGTACSPSSAALFLNATAQFAPAPSNAFTASFLFSVPPGPNSTSVLYDLLMKPAWADRAIRNVDWQGYYSLGSSATGEPLFTCRERPDAVVSWLPTMFDVLASGPSVADASVVALYQTSITLTTSMLAAVFGYVPSLTIPDLLCTFVTASPSVDVSSPLAELAVRMQPNAFGQVRVGLDVVLWASVPEFAAAWGNLSFPGGTTLTAIRMTSGPFGFVFPPAYVTAMGTFGHELIAASLEPSAASAIISAFNPVAAGISIQINQIAVQLCCAACPPPLTWNVTGPFYLNGIGPRSTGSVRVPLEGISRTIDPLTPVEVRTIDYEVNWGYISSHIVAASPVATTCQSQSSVATITE